ncbi:MAG: nickel-dependent hydrogenase large subunit [Desulfitobacteriia bacterium]|jgi:hydrogenase large subunit
MATKRIVIDPVTRIEGHLRVEAVVEGNKITDAISSSTIFRGIEIIVQNRDPRDAWAFMQRICGVCTHTHALASIRAVEDALKITVPKNANLIRNIMSATQDIQDHAVHFYHLHGFDWIDVVSALKADPAQTSAIAMSISQWPLSTTSYFTDIQNKIKKLVESSQLGIFANAYWGHPAYKLPPEVNLLGVAHYLEALNWQKEIVKIHAVFGGKNPHPNYVVGGVPSAINLNSHGVINMERLNLVKSKIDEAKTFVEQVLIPDILAIAGFYKNELWGGGLRNYMSYGDYPQTSINEPASFLVPRGIVLDGDLTKVYEVDLKDPEQIHEFVDHSWFRYEKPNAGLHPWEGKTEPHYDGPKPPYQYLDENKGYSWSKSPRWRGKPMEVGPLARFVVGYAKGDEEIRHLVDSSLQKLDLPLTALFSTLGRTLARALETQHRVNILGKFYKDLIANIKAGDTATFNNEKWNPHTWPAEAQGVGFSEAPRGALGHWVEIKDGKIANYQAVVPTTWNASPRDANKQLGAYEAAIIDTPLANPEQPLEVLRTIHSFDPCIACACHLLDPQGYELNVVKAY